MCGIIGYLDKRPGDQHPIGEILLSMLQALACRGPDSTGAAIYGPRNTLWTLQIKLPDQHANAVVEALQSLTAVIRHEIVGAYLNVQIPQQVEPLELERRLLALAPGAEIVSLGHQLTIVKQVGTPSRLDQDYKISRYLGTHGIGHTRLSTESKVDLSHSQPFWAHGIPDLATVHNGHVTNYHKLRRQYEQRGYRFFTENDSEVIGIYLRDRMAKGLSFEDALRASLDDLDGSYSYLAATADRFAYVRDRFGFKPLVIAENDRFVAIATEEIALRRSLGRDFSAREPEPGTMRVWSIHQGTSGHSGSRVESSPVKAAAF